MESQRIRRAFLEYFKKHNHTIVPSSPVIPHDDPTLLFTNAGMNQFKDVFLGKSIRDDSRAVTSQKCIRAGGKHNDLENVGHTKRHLTFFEMMGNFSFGDYFKKEAIRFAWEVSTEVFGFDPDYLWPTVFREDDEAFELWRAYVPAERITRFDEKENFWAMGDTGPCGPCSELLYDRGPKYGSGRTPLEDPSGERFLEYWNLVFMQYNRSSSGEMAPLPKPCVDTGGGLERIVGLSMDVPTVFGTDLLRGLIAQVEEVSGQKYEASDLQKAPIFHVIADHIRSLSFAIADGAQPSNVDRGYVLRKILRRAVRYGRQLGLTEPFMGKVLPRLIDGMGEDYPELKQSASRIEEILTVEEEAFIRTLRRGGNILQQVMERAQRQSKVISGDDAFKLKDTYGFPLEEIQLIAKDEELTLDLPRYEELEQEAKERSRAVHQSVSQQAEQSVFESFASEHPPCQFTGFESLKGEGTVRALLSKGSFVSQLQEGQEGAILLDQTPFYAEKGGQVGDRGELKGEGGASFQVQDCQSPYKGVVVHHGVVKGGEISVGQKLTASVCPHRRKAVANNHTATHLLHWALQQVLGEHVKQAGSVVDADRLRFDFSHHKGVSEEELERIEDLINGKIRTNASVGAYELSYEQAQQREDIKQFFGDKYGATVRVVDMDFSKELCGGTHAEQLGSIGYFRIAKEMSIAAGVRRIEAVTGKEAEAVARQPEKELLRFSQLLKTSPKKLDGRLQQLLSEQEKMVKELKELKKAQQGQVLERMAEKMEQIHGVPLLAQKVDLDPKDLRGFADQVMAKFSSIVLVLGVVTGEKCQLLVRVSDDLVAKGIRANEMIRTLGPVIQGGGGGKPNSAQAGGKAPENMDAALAQSRELIPQSC